MTDLRCGNCLTLMKELPDASIDCIITDPPYKTEFVPLYGQMAEQAARVLKDGGLLIALAGHFALHRIIPEMNQHLTYYWIGGMPNKAGSVARNFSRQIMCAWKPVLWFSRGKVPDHEFVFDLFQSKRIERENHKWEQSLGWFEYYVEKLTREGDTVLDPFMGSGTTGVACVKLGRNFIGYEINPDAFKVAERRIADAQMQLALPIATEGVELHATRTE